MEWRTTPGMTQVFEDGVLVGEVVQVPGQGWVARDANGSWFHEEVCQSRAQAIEHMYNHLVGDHGTRL